MTQKITSLSKGCIYLFIYVYCFCGFTHLTSQTNLNFGKEIEFISHLQDNSEFKNSIYLGNKIDAVNLNDSQRDSLNYYLGWASYNIKRLDTSVYYLNKITVQSAFYNKSVFYAANNYSYLQKYDEALKATGTFTDTNFRQLSYLQMAGIHLLRRDYKSFDSISRLFDYSNFNVAAEQKEMLVYEKNLKSFKRKSPLVAGLLSAAIPGLGKFYAGKKGQSLATAAACFITGIVAAENLWRGGPESPQFIVTSTIFGFFYFGNIWGSVLSVKLARQSFNNKTDNEIRVSIHLPLRRIFN
jgi:hypothetical protein